MVPVGNEAKQFLLVKSSAKTIHQQQQHILKLGKLTNLPSLIMAQTYQEAYLGFLLNQRSCCILTMISFKSVYAATASN